MPNDLDSAGRHRLGRRLVALQFALMGALGLLALAGLRTPPTGAMAALAVAGVALTFVLAAWTLAANRPGNFNIHPSPRDGGRLVTRGPYRWIRHPMYTTVLVAGAVAVLLSDRAWLGLAALCWAALVAVLAAKARLEEAWMTEVHPAYADYRRHTRCFVPWLW